MNAMIHNFILLQTPFNTQITHNFCFIGVYQVTFKIWDALPARIYIYIIFYVTKNKSLHNVIALCKSVISTRALKQYKQIDAKYLTQ